MSGEIPEITDEELTETETRCALSNWPHSYSAFITMRKMTARIRADGRRLAELRKKIEIFEMSSGDRDTKEKSNGVI